LLGFGHKIKILFKILVSTFGLSLDTLDVNKFYLNKIRRKLNYWSITRRSLGRRVFIVHCVFLATLWYFLSIWVGFKLTIERARSMNISYLWSRSEFLTPAWVKWIDCCLECQKGRLGNGRFLNQVDPTCLSTTRV
jgi:hypothetical protein